MLTEVFCDFDSLTCAHYQVMLCNITAKIQAPHLKQLSLKISFFLHLQVWANLRSQAADLPKPIISHTFL